MPVTASDIKVYGAANHAENDSSTQGGAIDTTVVMIFDDSALANTLNDTLDIVSSDAADTTQTVTITGRNSAGSIVSETLNLNGTTTVNGATTFERILKIVCSASHAGDISIKKNTGGTTVGTLLGTTNAPGGTAELTLRRPFYNVSADVAGGSSRDYYEKCFIKNNNTTNALLSAQVAESADPSGNITFDLEDAVNDINSTASRLNTAPTGMLGTFDNTTKSVPGTDLGAGAAIGMWLKLTLAAGAAASKTTWTVQVTGSTT